MSQNELLRHFLVALVYRCSKAVDNAPAHYPHFELGEGVRTPIEILSHMSHVLQYAHSVYGFDVIAPPHIGTWEEEIARFHQILLQLDQSLAEGLPEREQIAERLLQGPLSDAMTHVGQLSMLRRMVGDPVPGENFFKADIRVGSPQTKGAEPPIE